MAKPVAAPLWAGSSRSQSSPWRFLDADGEPLRLGLDAGPSLIEPNVAYAEHLLDRPLPDEAAILAAARELVRRGVETLSAQIGILHP